MNGILDLFLATPLGSRSLMQRALSIAINDGIKNVQKSVDSLTQKIDDPILCSKLKTYTDADEDIRQEIQRQSRDEDIDIIVAILRSEELGQPLEPQQIEKVFNAFVAYTSAVDNVSVILNTSSIFC
jgi:hypothetical protein